MIEAESFLCRAPGGSNPYLGCDVLNKRIICLQSQIRPGGDPRRPAGAINNSGLGIYELAIGGAA